MQTLKEMCEQLYEYHRGGWFNLHRYRRPQVPDELAGEKDEWYVIKMPDSLWVLRASDVPAGNFSYTVVLDMVLVFIRQKTEAEYRLEEEWERKIRRIRNG